MNGQRHDTGDVQTWRRRSARCALTLATVQMLCVACEDERLTVALPGGGGADASVATDAGGNDDAATPPPVDASGSLPAGACTVLAMHTIAFEEKPGVRSWAALQQDDVVHIAYALSACGGGMSSGSAIHHRVLQADGALSEPVQLTEISDSACDTAEAPALANDAKAGVQLFYESNAGRSNELYRRSVAGTGSAQQLTFDPEGSEDNELETASGAWGGTPVVAYSNRIHRTDVSGISTQRSGAAELQVLPSAAGQSPIRLVVSPLLTKSDVGLLGWVNQRPTGSTIAMQSLDASGAARGDRVELTAAAGEASNVAFASSAEHAAVIYTEAAGSIHQLRFRPLDASGVGVGAATALTTPNRNVVSASIAPYASGYVIAFRELPLDTMTVASIKLMFVTWQGVVGGERRLADTTRGSGDTQVFVTRDGRLIVLSSDSSASSSLQVVRASCL